MEIPETRVKSLALGLFILLWHLAPQTVAAQGASPAPARQAPSTSLSGYMELNYTKLSFGAEEPDPLEEGQLDFRRFVLLIVHPFSDRIRFVGELELEHAFVEGLEPGGELELEQAYLDFLLTRPFNIRAGMVLMPVGIINERHEPPTYYGVHRPFVDTFIIPSTWFEAGAGVHGEVRGGWRYRLYVTSPLNAAEFSADEGIRGGRQKGSQTNIGRAGTTGRLEYVGLRGLTAGASFWTGKSGFEFRPRFDVPVRLFEMDARYARAGLELRAQFAQVGIVNAAEINDAGFRLSGVDPNVARGLRGAYLETGYRRFLGRVGELGGFLRYENFDTQFRMPDGYLPLKEFDRDAWVFGATYWPDPDIAVKIDYIVQRNRSTVIVAPDSFNVGLGWWF
jgi:hypothetical protein